MAIFNFVAASSAVFAVRTALMTVRILFFSAELRAVRCFMRRISFIDDLMIGMIPPEIYQNENPRLGRKVKNVLNLNQSRVINEKWRLIVNEHSGTVNNG
jgi:hypothetical protein